MIFHKFYCLTFIFNLNLNSNFREIQIWRSCAFPGPPKFNQASNRPENCAKLTGMDIGEFTIYNAYLSSALICLIAINAVGGVE